MSNLIYFTFKFKGFINSLKPGMTIQSYYDKNVSYVVVGVDLSRERVKIHQSNTSSAFACWYDATDFIVNKK